MKNPLFIKELSSRFLLLDAFILFCKKTCMNLQAIRHAKYKSPAGEEEELQEENCSARSWKVTRMTQ